MKNFLSLLALLPVLFLAPACKSKGDSDRGDGPPPPEAGQTVYLTVGMHFEPQRGQYVGSTTNYVELPVFVPAGTEFEMVGQSRKEVTLRSNGNDYVIRYDARNTMIPLEDWLARQFAGQPVTLPADLTAEERTAIEQGVCQPGMSRAAVFLALGYPPKSSNPSEDAKLLTYGARKFVQRHVAFDEQDRVSSYTR